jgi:L-rhamnose mutarotase
MQRVCFRLQVRPELRDEYVERHAAVWPDMLEALKATGWHNYSLFLDDDGTLIGYFETPDLDAAVRGMAGREVNARWQGEMGKYFAGLDDTPPDQGFRVLERIFGLEDQLATHGAPSDAGTENTR